MIDAIGFWVVVGIPVALVLVAVVAGVSASRMSPEARRRADARLEERRARAASERGRVVDVEFETSRPTVTRTAAGGLLGGPVGALVGFAWRKKRKQTVRIPR